MAKTPKAENTEATQADAQAAANDQNLGQTSDSPEPPATIPSAPVRSAKDSDDEDLLTSFLKASGFKPSEVDGQNDRTRVFVTTNGGKYQLGKKNNTVRRISGPPYPKEFKKPAED